MTTAATKTPATRPVLLGRVGWLLTGLGLLLAAVPFVADTVTNREPDALFTRAWWSPVAAVPATALTIGSLGVAVLAGVGSAVLLSPLRQPAFRVGLATAVLVAQVVGWSLAAAWHRDATAQLASSTLQASAGRIAGPPVSEPVHALELAEAFPAGSPATSRITVRGSVPAGPLIVQLTHVSNVGLSDEAAEVDVGSLVDPVSGQVIAAWFWGF